MKCVVDLTSWLTGRGLNADLAVALDNVAVGAIIGYKRTNLFSLTAKKIRMLRFKIAAGLIATLSTASMSFAEQNVAPELGWSTEKPADGPFVEVDGKFMVPYKATIPGTNVEYTMIPIPGGSFTMGSPADEVGRESDEGPQRKIKVEPFWMGKTEVTWGEYKTFMGLYSIFKGFVSSGLHKIDDQNRVDAITVPTPLYEPSHTYEFGDDPHQPAVTMTQYAAKQYTKWLSGMTGVQYRIPTEAEWEYAARAGSNTAYSFGNDASELPQYAAFSENAPDGPAVVGSFAPNAFGLFDMHGNAWEWVLDHYSEEGYEAAEGELNWKDAIAWPKDASSRTVRGGGFQDDAATLRSAVRLGSADEDWKNSDPNIPLSPWWFTDDPARAVGMRIVRSAKPLDKELITKFWEIDNDMIKEDVEIRLEEGRGVLGLPRPELAEQLKGGNP